MWMASAEVHNGSITHRPLADAWIALKFRIQHYNDVIMGAIACQITSLTIVYSIVYWDADQRKHQSSASLAFVRRIHRWPVNSPHKWPVARKIFSFDDVIMMILCILSNNAVVWMSIIWKESKWAILPDKCTHLLLTWPSGPLIPTQKSSIKTEIVYG